MSIKRESTQSIPSVMAKLMGLDEIPTQQPVPKKPRVLSENYLRRVSSIGVREKCSAQQPFKFSMEELDEYKNVLQVLESLRRKKLRHKAVANDEVHLDSSDVKRRFVMQKVEGKNVSEDGKRQISQESHDDYILEYLQKPDFWCTKKLSEPNDVHSNLQLGHSAVLNLPLASDCRDISKCMKFRRNSEFVYLNAPKEVRNSHRVYSSRGLSINGMSEFWRSIPTSRIVVTKSNPKANIVARSQSDSASNSGDGKKNGVLIPPNKSLYIERKERKSMSNGIEPVRPRFRFLKERIKSIVETRSEHSDSDHFAKEFELTMPSSPTLSDRKRQINSSGGSYMIKEAKKQISERWKTTKRFQQVDLPGRSETPGEMLAIPNKPGKCSGSNQGALDIGNMSCDSPFGMNNWGSWRHEFVEGLPISRSLLPYFNAVGSPNSKMKQESLENGGCMRELDSINTMNELREQESNQKDGLECRKESTNNKSKASAYMVPESNLSVGDCVGQDEQENKLKKGSTVKISAGSQSSAQNNQTLQDMWIKQKGHKIEVGKDDLTENNSIVPNSMKSFFSIGTEVDAEAQAAKKFPSNYEKHQLESSSCILLGKEEDSSSHIQDASYTKEMSNGTFEDEYVSSQCSCTDLESLISCEEAYQPSPNSVLERSCKKENSSDCFKSVNASLHGLYMQLELLKEETSETYSEGSSMVVSSDDDNGEGSVNDFEEHKGLISPFRVEESRDFSYLVDVLTEAGFQNRNLLSGLDTLHSQEFPIRYSVFETLEKKYGEQLSWKRTERRLLFDRINSGLTEMFQPFRGALTWSKPVARRFVFSQGDEMIEEELWMLLASQEKEVIKESEKIMGKDDGWMELGDEIQIIGREIEDSLIDELVADVSMQSFC